MDIFLFYLCQQKIALRVESQQDSKSAKDFWYPIPPFPCHKQNQKTQGKVAVTSWSQLS